MSLGQQANAMKTHLFLSEFNYKRIKCILYEILKKFDLINVSIIKLQEKLQEKLTLTEKLIILNFYSTCSEVKSAKVKIIPENPFISF